MRRVVPREFRFPISVTWEGGRRTTAHVEGKAPLAIAPPPEFKGTHPELWSPEDAFVAAAAGCLAVTITGLVERERLPMHALDVTADGVVGKRPDGRFGFVCIEERVVLETDVEHAEAARSLIAKAEETCLVAVSLDLPVHTAVEIRVHRAAA